jgi:hypothetical protein
VGVIEAETSAAAAANDAEGSVETEDAEGGVAVVVVVAVVAEPGAGGGGASSPQSVPRRCFPLSSVQVRSEREGGRDKDRGNVVSRKRIGVIKVNK